MHFKGIYLIHFGKELQKWFFPMLVKNTLGVKDNVAFSL